MPHGRVAHGALDAGRGRKGRVHQHGRGPDRGVEIVVDLLGVEGRDRRLREQARQQPMTRFGKLVQGKPGACDLGMDGEKAGSGRRFEHKLARRHLSRKRHQESEAQRRRKLLELVAFLGAARMRGQQRRKLPDHRERAGGTAGLFQDAGAVFAQEQDGGGLGGFIGVFPEPGAMLVAGLESGRHRFAQQMRVERNPAFKRSKKLGGGGQQPGGFRVLGSGQARGRGRLRGRRGHGQVLS